MMQALLLFVYPLATGVVLGLFYYGGLWFVLSRLSRYRFPAVWLGLSLLLRILAVAGVLYLLFAHSWQQLMLAVLGMLVSRTLLVQRIRPGARADKRTGPTP